MRTAGANEGPAGAGSTAGEQTAGKAEENRHTNLILIIRGMTILLRIYLWSALGSILHILLIALPIGAIQKDPRMKKTSEDFNEGKFSYKLAIVLLPLLNTYFAFLFLFLLVATLSFYIQDYRIRFAAWATRRLMGTGKYFKLREWIVRNIFPMYYEAFEKSFDNDPLIKKFVRSYKNLIKNEKAKPQSESHSEPHPDGSPEKTPDEREINNPDQSP